MEPKAASKSAPIRARLSHPIIDLRPSGRGQVRFLDYLKEVGGPSVIKRFKNATYDSFYHPDGVSSRHASATTSARCARRGGRPARNTRDLATALLPNCFTNG